MRQSSLENSYPYRIRVIILGIVLIIAIVLFAFPRFRSNQPIAAVSMFDEVLEEINIPETRQFDPPPPPPRPSIPIESEREDFAEDITIEETALDEYDLWEVPPLPDDDADSRIKFIPYDEPPVPIGGFAAISEKLVYPPMAKKAEIEGTVVLQVFVSDKGLVEDMVVQKGLPGTGLDEAAVRAIKQVRFKPAMQRDTAVGVWIAIPIRFRLTMPETHS
ncbi:MAG: energy transducer TonB [Fidelibacterota bacterium]|nr:MAG: energy transducer TonB [Candidatus Neomarinimicrobiota bacterium]